MKTMTPKLLVSLCAALMLCMAMAGYAAATEMTVTETLNFTSQTEDVTQDAYTWEYDGNGSTLTITDALTIQTTAQGIFLPAGATLVVDAPLTIETDGHAIVCTGDFTMNVNADTSITSVDYNGMNILGDLALTVQETIVLDITASSATAVYATSGSATITCNGIMVIKSQLGGINAGDDVTLGGTGALNISASSSIYTTGAINFENGASLTISTNGVIRGVANSSGYTIPESMALHTVLKADTDYTIYGDYTPSSSGVFHTGTSLTYAAGARLIIAQGLTIDLSNFTSFTYEDGYSIVNDGLLILPNGMDGDDIEPLNISSSESGMVWVANTDGSYHVYTNEGVLIATTQDIELTDSEVFEADGLGYTWLEGTNGVYTLTVLSDSLYGNIYFEVSDAILNLTQDFTVQNIIFGWSEKQDNERIDHPTNLTITGNYTLTNSQEGVSGTGTLTIGEGVTLNAPVIWLESYGTDGDGADGQGVDGELSDLYVHGTLQANIVLTGDMTVSNTGTVILTHLGGDFTYAASGDGEAPTVTLGDKIKVLSPEGAYFAAEEHLEDGVPTGVYIGFFYNSDGSYVTDLTIGKKPSTPTVTNPTVTAPTVTTPTPEPEPPTSPPTGEVGIVAWFVAWVAATFA